MGEISVTDSNRPVLIVAGIVAVCAVGAAFWIGTSIRGLRSELEASRKASDTGMATIVGNLGLVQGELAMIRNNPLGPGPTNQTDDGTLQVVFKTDADVVAEILTLQGRPTVDSYARVLSEIDEWIITPTDEPVVQGRIAKLLPPLRALIKSDVVALQDAALKEKTGELGAAQLDEAGRRLALYPMSDDAAVLTEAKALSVRQTQALVHLEGLRRQRYNQWALVSVAKAIDYYNANASSWNPMASNAPLLKPLADQLSEIDPLLLEPAVSELYTYIIGKTKEGLSDKDKVGFAKQLTDPAKVRKTLGEF